MKKRLVVFASFIIFVVLWTVIFSKFSSSEQILYPSASYEVYALTDANVGGFSTSELTKGDSFVSARVNIRSGTAYAYAGLGLNLLSINNRPAADFFDFEKFDSMTVLVETERMRKVSLRILNDDPIYSKGGSYSSYRPLVATIDVPAKSGDSVRIAMSSFKVPEWWLAGQGLEKDDGLRYMQRGMLFEVYNGEGTLRGIPDEITLRSVLLWGENRTFKSLMYLALGLGILAFAAAVYLLGKKK